MTIDSSWIACFKEEVPCAFTPRPPFQPDAVFVDGQIRLMPPTVEGMLTWDDYVFRQFKKPVYNYFARDVSCVVLAFDDYAHVPAAKNMTQAKRRKNVPSLDFHARDCLPPCVPRGEEFTRCISNRTFKSKVIQLVVHQLVSSLRCDEGQCLVVDYAGHPVRHYSVDSRRPSEPISEFGPLGEADVKFVRYTDIFPKLQVDSVDGDSLPIALLQMERGHSGRISVLRMQTRIKGDPPASSVAAAKPPAKKARVADGPPAAAPAEEPRRPSRVYEYVDVRLLYEALVGTVIPQVVGRGTRVPSHAGHEISMLVCLIGLSGTDFTRGLPLVSGKTLYEFMPQLWMRLCRCYLPAERRLAPEAALELLVSRIYHEKFPRHSPDSELGAVLGALQRSKLSGKTKERLPTPEVLLCTVKNVNWLLRYWHEMDPPDPVQPEFGFCRGRGGAVMFEA
jgi:hypothetical protein